MKTSAEGEGKEDDDYDQVWTHLLHNFHPKKSMSTSNKLTPHQPIHHYTANSSNYQIQVTQFTIQIKLSPKSSPGPTKQNGKKNPMKPTKIGETVTKFEM